ncbi:hypothetical protein L198_07155 [Cryptococcus wingfieldii CBS 7118]|uniref:Uncharacterized protein n=1 Tax=Cryptococcus wingfieldii CBS 7118 TaxID=1295528 RepID=A0A1E3IDX5_9TREE|nr:hypothetical protein L198_07155 [Cryptococcus wingfieldii CBS 7118]ODN86793.1 hypothetical protein L198_07155 [Cryptococcus wingfieldii CBS 7118]
MAAPGPSPGLAQVRAFPRSRTGSRKNTPSLPADRLFSEKEAGQTIATTNPKTGQEGRSGKVLALGYAVIEVGEDEDSVPPLSVFYPPSSHPKPAQARPQCFARRVLLGWLSPRTNVYGRWCTGYCRRHSFGMDETTVNGELDLFTDDVHYIEPLPANVGTTTYAGVGPLLPLGSGTSTRSSEIPSVVVCTKADLMDNAAEDVKFNGGRWEEKTDRARQALGNVCLAYGAALFYTAPTQPTTYALLKSYTVPPPLISPPASPNTVSAPAIVGSTKFPFNHRANVLDRDAAMIPSGWDSWGKINVLRDGSDPAQLEKGWKVSLSRYGDPQPTRPPHERPQPRFQPIFRHAASATSSSNVPSGDGRSDWRGR